MVTNVYIKNAEFSLFKGEHVGIVGANGVGKSTFINICTGNTIPDEGQIRWQPGISRGYLDQHAAADAQQTVLEYMQASFSALFERRRRWYRLINAIRPEKRTR